MNIASQIPPDFNRFSEIFVSSKNGGKIAATSGPPAAGKDTLMEGLFQQLGKDTLELESTRQLSDIRPMVSYTTRPMRPGEINGKQYHFLKPEELVRMIKNGEVAELRTIMGNQYGLLLSEFDNFLKGGIGVINLRAEDALHLKGISPESVKTIFVDVPTNQGLERMIKRDAAIRPKLVERILYGCNEKILQHKFDSTILNPNGQLERSIKKFIRIIKSLR